MTNQPEKPEQNAANTPPGLNRFPRVNPYSEEARMRELLLTELSGILPAEAYKPYYQRESK